ncbi:DUF1127 domain-containing protein [Bosea massiliensis]|uniref:DUF1127 domain-containing protein n=1 Tax=Bosea massiliensis TaxID=151419 RepID=A0ABW0P1F5_9HYPH
MLAILTAKINSYLRYRATAKALSRLSDRALNDIGITRMQIDSVARIPR